MQTNQKQNNCFETFAWLIHREVESYVNEHEKELIYGRNRGPPKRNPKRKIIV